MLKVSCKSRYNERPEKVRRQLTLSSVQFDSTKHEYEFSSRAVTLHRSTSCKVIRNTAFLPKQLMKINIKYNYLLYLTFVLSSMTCQCQF